MGTRNHNLHIAGYYTDPFGNRFPYCNLYPLNKRAYYIKEHIEISVMNDGL